LTSILTLVNASSERKTPQIRSRKYEATNDAECLPNCGRIVTCCRAKLSRPFGWILRPNFGVCWTLAHLYGILALKALFTAQWHFGDVLQVQSTIIFCDICCFRSASWPISSLKGVVNC